MKIVSEPAAKRIVFACLLIFMPTFLYLGLVAGIMPFSLLLYTAILTLRQGWALSFLVFGHVLAYSFVIYVLSYWVVRYIYRCSSISLRLAVLTGLVSLPILIGCLPIFTVGGIRGGEEPSNIWHYFQHFYETNWRQLSSIIGAFVLGVVITLILTRRSNDPRTTDC